MNKPRFIIILIAALIAATTAVHHTQSTSQPQFGRPSTNQPINQFTQLPLLFVENQGQWDDQVAYAVQGSDKTLYFTPDGITFSFIAPVKEEDSEENERPISRLNSKPTRTQRYTVKLDFLGANPNVQPIGQEPDTAVISYFKGQPDEWHTGLPTYRRIIYPNLWPGIDLIYEGTVNRLKYHFLVHPGADPNQIRLAYRGATSITLNDAGQLHIQTPLGSFSDDTPVAYQEINGQQIPVEMAYALEDKTSNAQPYHFTLGSYDPTLPLILDPVVIIYSGYIGGSGFEQAIDISVDEFGNAYITGYTNSTESTFPVTIGPDLTYGGNGDAFIVKINPTGTGLVYGGFIGGNDDDTGLGITVDNNGNAYVVGLTYTDEATFPVLVGPDLTHNGNMDGFVVKVNSTGTGLIYAGYIGGSEDDVAGDIALDDFGNVYVGGGTDSDESTFPVTVGPDLTYNGGGDNYVAKIKPDGSGLVYAGYIGGNNSDSGQDFTVDNLGNAYMVGWTDSTEATFPVINGPDLTYNGGVDIFISKVNPTGTGLVYSGYIGGVNLDFAHGVSVDDTGNAYLTGGTFSDETSFPVIVGPDLTFNAGFDNGDAFVAKVNSTGTGLIYAGYIGGYDDDRGNGIAVDETGSAYVVGTTLSDEFTFPILIGPDLTHNGGYDGFVAKVNPLGNELVYAGYIGGDDFDFGYDIAVDGFGDAYLVGDTQSNESTFPVTVGPDLTFNGLADAFITKVSVQDNAPEGIMINGPTSGLIGSTNVFSATTMPVTTTLPLSYSWQATGQMPVTHTSGLTDTAVYTWNIPGPKTITVTASNTVGTVTNTHAITIYEPVSADFTATPTTGSTPLNVTFTNLSTGDYTTCLWDFGDGSTSAACALVDHLYTQAGVYTVTLTINGPGGIDTVTKVDYIGVNPTLYLPVILKP